MKKDKTLDELREGMVEQLDVFLQNGECRLRFWCFTPKKSMWRIPRVMSFICLNITFSETKTFVQLLFKTLETQEYVMPVKTDLEDGATPPGVNPPPPIPANDKVEVPAIVPMVVETPLQVNGSTSAVGKREARKSESDREDKEKVERSR